MIATRLSTHRSPTIRLQRLLNLTAVVVGGFLWLQGLCCSVAAADEAVVQVGHPLPQQQRDQLRMQWETVLKQNPIPEANAANATDVHSRRGDALFFLGQFPEAVREYSAMVQINPALDASHWRLGIALFFADQPRDAVAQFEKYHSFDNVDRENGIWRYLSQYKASGAEVAQKELLKYDKDDREPFPAVYRLFDGSLTPEAAVALIGADLPPGQRSQRLFYTDLYIGMHAVVKGDLKLAEQHLHSATANEWPRTSGFGPNYMWHVGRLQWELLHSKRTQNATPKP
jgi:lipoprotein NlpI